MRKRIETLLKTVLLTGFVVVMISSAAGAPIQLENDRVVMNRGNITTLGWLNPGGENVSIGGNVDLGQLNITNCAFIEGTKCENLGAQNVQDTYVDESGDTMTGNLNLSWNNLTDVGLAGIDIGPNGEIDMQAQNISDLPSPVLDSQPTTLGFANSEYVQRSGDSMTGDLDLNGYDLVNVDTIGNGTSDMAISSNVDLLGNSILNYFGSGCGSGQAVQDVDDAGTFTCVSLSSGVSDNFVNESGDTMTGDLDMSGNDINNVKSLTGQSGENITVFNPLDMNSNRIQGLQQHNSGDDAMRRDDILTEFVDEAGGETITGNIDMDGNLLQNVDALGNGTSRTIAMTSSGGVVIPAGYLNISGGDLDVGENAVLNVNVLRDGTGTDTLVFDGGNNIDIANGDLTVSGRLFTGTDGLGFGNLTNYPANCGAGEAIRLLGDGSHTCIDVAGTVANTYVNESGDTVTGTLNLDGNNLTFIGAGGINLSAADGDVQLNSNRIEGLQQHDSGDDAMRQDDIDTTYVNEEGGETITGNLDLDGNLLQNVDAIGNGTDRTIQMTTGGNVEVPNGNLSLTGSNSQIDLNNPSTNGATLDIGGNMNVDSHAFFYGQVNLQGNENIALRGNYLSNDADDEGVQITDTGDVAIPSGDLRVDDGSSDSGIYLQESGTNKALLYWDADQDRFVIRDHQEGDDLIHINKNGPYVFRNPTTGNAMLRMNNSEGSDVEIPNGNLKLANTNAFEIEDTGGTAQRVATLTGSDHVLLGDLDSAAGDTYIRDDGTNSIIAKNGNVEIPIGNLDMTNSVNDIQLANDAVITFNNAGGAGRGVFSLNPANNLEVGDPGAGIDHVGLYAGGSIGLNVTKNRNVEIPNGNLDISGNQITGIATGGTHALQANVDANNVGENPLTLLDITTQNGVDIQWEANRSAGDAFTVTDDSVPQKLFNVGDGGNVKIPNGNLKMMGGGNVEFYNGGTNDFGLRYDTGNDFIHLYDAGSGYIMKWHGGTQNVEIPNGDLNMSGNYINDVDVMTGSLVVEDGTRWRDLLRGRKPTYNGTWDKTGNPALPDTNSRAETSNFGSAIEWTLSNHDDDRFSNTIEFLFQYGGGWYPEDTGSGWTAEIQVYRTDLNGGAGGWDTMYTFDNTDSGSWHRFTYEGSSTRSDHKKIRINITDAPTDYARFGFIQLYADTLGGGWTSQFEAAKFGAFDKISIGTTNVSYGSTLSVDGDVQVSNGNLDMTGSNNIVGVGGDVKFDQGALIREFNSGGGAGNFRIRPASGNNYDMEIQAGESSGTAGAIHLEDSNSNEILNAYPNNNVEIPNGNLYVDDANGVVVGDTSQISHDFTHEMQVLGTGAGDSGQTIARFSNNVADGHISFIKSRASSIGGASAVSSGDDLGSIGFRGDDGSDYSQRAVSIETEADGTIGTDQIPGLIKILTADSSGSLTKALEINSNQNVNIPNGNLNIQSGVEAGEDIIIGGDPSYTGGDEALINATGEKLVLQSERDWFTFVDASGDKAMEIRSKALAVGSNLPTGMNAGDINISTLYYDTQSAKSPIVSCSQGSDWCKVTIPENQTSFYVEKGEKWDKDRPRETAEEVVESSTVELAERVDTLEAENQEQEDRIQELTASVCGMNPNATVCS